jgi:signal transduction histidine kinase
MQQKGNRMDTLTPVLNEDETVRRRADVFFQEQLDVYARRTDRMFAWLMGIQWLAGVVAALWISPRAWEGQYSHTHIHVWAALFLGGTISGFPILLALTRPGSVLTRHVIAVGQMLSCGLLIHLTGGRIETHFQYFGALAFLAFYRDWRVLLTASAVAGADHLLRGLYWPQSIFGVLVADWWRWLEHVGWVVFEDIFLVLAIRQNLSEIRGVAERQAKLETFNESIERTVNERTSELRSVHQQLLEASRRSGMAEIATNVLHNVGNVLNSVNISSSLIADGVRKSRASDLAGAVLLMKEHKNDLGTFITLDSRGQHLTAHLAQLSEHLMAEQMAAANELASLRQNIDHIKEIVAMQQNYATFGGVKEIVNVLDLVKDGMRMHEAGLQRHSVDVVRDFAEVPPVNIEKHKVLQILVNLLSNAKHACQESARVDKRVTIRVAKTDDKVRILVMDNGVGIAPENLTRIFNYGFTTRKGGHGFGLHSGALAAKEIGGSLTVQSDGPGQGASFTLELPQPTKEKSHA